MWDRILARLALLILGMVAGVILGAILDGVWHLIH